MHPSRSAAPRLRVDACVLRLAESEPIALRGTLASRRADASHEREVMGSSCEAVLSSVGWVRPHEPEEWTCRVARRAAIERASSQSMPRMHPPMRERRGGMQGQRTAGLSLKIASMRRPDSAHRVKDRVCIQRMGPAHRGTSSAHRARRRVVSRFADARARRGGRRMRGPWRSASNVWPLSNRSPKASPPRSPRTSVGKSLLLVWYG